ncbi:unnamed protein product [Anisakis simplex]|uniref:Uncharacterized protein n=1 Tax=Anisakis simplex TaxID=6269 RepID=A0A0M3K0A7_ANISI|nr:unnamed protein product [Anisakis simplex]
MQQQQYHYMVASSSSIKRLASSSSPGLILQPSSNAFTPDHFSMAPLAPNNLQCNGAAAMLQQQQQQQQPQPYRATTSQQPIAGTLHPSGAQMPTIPAHVLPDGSDS